MQKTLRKILVNTSSDFLNLTCVFISSDGDEFVSHDLTIKKYIGDTKAEFVKTLRDLADLLESAEN